MIKRIEAIIRTEKLNATTKALSAIGVVGLTVQPVKGRRIVAQDDAHAHR